MRGLGARKVRDLIFHGLNMILRDLEGEEKVELIRVARTSKWYNFNARGRAG